MSPQGDPQPWTAKTLADAFAELGYSITPRTIEGWRKGRIPKPPNIYALARVASGGDDNLRQRWSAALLVEPSPAPAAPEPAASPRALNKPLIIGAAGLGLCLVGVFGYVALSPNIQVLPRGTPEISNITFCDADGFNLKRLACTAGRDGFPTDAAKIYVSFQMDNVYDGQSFSRTWFRNGEKWLEKNTYVTDAWQGYTWIHSKHGYDPGEYVMQVVVEGTVAAAKFTIDAP